MKAKAEADLVQANEEKESAMLELEQISDPQRRTSSKLRLRIRKFRNPANSADDEVEALRQAKDIFPGAKFEILAWCWGLEAFNVIAALGGRPQDQPYKKACRPLQQCKPSERQTLSALAAR